MKGIVINILEQMVCEKFGEETMEEVYDKVSFKSDAPPFVGPLTYPDEDILAIVSFLVEKTAIPPDDLLFEFGKYMFPVFYQYYPIFFENVDSPITFLASVNDIIHVEVRKLFQEAMPPSVKIIPVDDNHVTLYYQSERKLCRLLEGLLEGVATHFMRKVTYNQRQCMKNGADQCVYEVTFHVA